MRGKSEQHHTIDALFVLLAFGVFAVCVLLVLLTGAQSYRAQTERDQRSWEQRTGIGYVAAKVRHTDEKDAISLFGGEDSPWYDALRLTETIDGEQYVTSIYFYDGYIRELFTVPGGDFAPGDGEKVMEAQALRFAWDEERGLLSVETTDVNGATSQLTLSARSGEGDAK